jgi:subtilisin family serine protease
MRVTYLLNEFAPDATFSFYQIVNEDEHVSAASLSDAVDDAVTDGVDILNISAGAPSSIPPELSAYSRAVRPAIRGGVTVVAAAGNYDHSADQPPVHVPAAATDVISVGGMVTECPQTPPIPRSEDVGGPYHERDYYREDSSPSAQDGVYCGYQGCVDEELCESQQVIRPWNGNPHEDKTEIDVLAPIHYPIETENGYRLKFGSSFAAPVVSGVLAEAYGDLRHNGHPIPEPYQVHQLVRQTALEPDQGQGRRLNAFQLKKQLERATEASSETAEHQ